MSFSTKNIDLEGENLNLEIENLNEKIKRIENVINEDEEKLKLINKNIEEKLKESTKIEFEEQIKEYDIIFKCVSLLDPFIINKHQNYINYIENENSMPIVSVIGSFDKGKTFILSELANKSFPSGFNFETDWICGYYPKLKKESNDKSKFLNAILLDTLGFETSVKFTKEHDFIVEENDSNVKIII